MSLPITYYPKNCFVLDRKADTFPRILKTEKSFPRSNSGMYVTCKIVFSNNDKTIGKRVNLKVSTLKKRNYVDIGRDTVVRLISNYLFGRDIKDVAIKVIKSLIY